MSLRVQPELVLALREALVFARGIKAAFVYGAAARSAFAPSPSLPRKRGREVPAAPPREDERPCGPIDLMVIGEADDVDCFGDLRDAEKALGRPIRATFVSVEEWRRDLARGSMFLTRVKAQPCIFIFASADDWGW